LAALALSRAVVCSLLMGPDFTNAGNLVGSFADTGMLKLTFLRNKSPHLTLTCPGGAHASKEPEKWTPQTDAGINWRNVIG
jgi:hypothetical protein